MRGTKLGTLKKYCFFATNIFVAVATRFNLSLINATDFVRMLTFCILVVVRYIAYCFFVIGKLHARWLKTLP